MTIPFLSLETKDLPVPRFHALPFACCLLLLALLAGPTSAQVPPVLTYQGVLSEPDGAPVDGLVGIAFDLYADAVGGLPVWSAQLDVLVELGLFEVELGEPANPLPQASFEGPLFLEVAVDGETLTPRQPLSSAPYALQAIEASRLEGRSASELDQAAAVATLSGVQTSITEDVAALESGLEAVEASPVLELESLLDIPAPGTLSVDGELVLGGGNVPLTVVDGFVGVNVQAALQDGVRAVSVDDSGFGFGGLFIHSGPTSTEGAGVLALGNQGSAPDLILGANDGSGSGDDGRIASDPSFASSDIFLDSNDGVVVQLDKDQSGEDADFVVVGRNDDVLLNVDESGAVSMKGPLDPGDGRPRPSGLFPIAAALVSKERRGRRGHQRDGCRGRGGRAATASSSRERRPALARLS